MCKRWLVLKQKAQTSGSIYCSSWAVVSERRAFFLTTLAFHFEEKKHHCFSAFLLEGFGFQVLVIVTNYREALCNCHGRVDMTQCCIYRVFAWCRLNNVSHLCYGNQSTSLQILQLFVVLKFFVDLNEICWFLALLAMSVVSATLTVWICTQTTPLIA